MNLKKKKSKKNGKGQHFPLLRDGLNYVLVSVFHSLNFTNTQSLGCVLFYKLGCRTEVEGLGNRRVFWQKNPNSRRVSQSPQLALPLRAQAYVGAGLVGAARVTPWVGRGVALQGPTVQPQLLGAQCWYVWYSSCCWIVPQCNLLFPLPTRFTKSQNGQGWNGPMEII